MKRLALVIIFIATIFVASGCDTVKEIWDSIPDFTAERDGEPVVGKDCKPGEDGKEDCKITLPPKKK